MYKSKEELLEMDIMEIAEYVKCLIETDEKAINNDPQYVEWCRNDLDDAMSELGYEPYVMIYEIIEGL